MVIKRRNFLKTLTGGISSGLMLQNIPEFLIHHGDNSWIQSKKDDSENFWNTIKDHFRFSPGLKYFNNASLGSCPEHVRKATNTFKQVQMTFASIRETKVEK